MSTEERVTLIKDIEHRGGPLCEPIIGAKVSPVGRERAQLGLNSFQLHQAQRGMACTTLMGQEGEGLGSFPWQTPQLRPNSLDGLSKSTLPSSKAAPPIEDWLSSSNATPLVSYIIICNFSAEKFEVALPPIAFNRVKIPHLLLPPPPYCKPSYPPF